MSKGSLLVSLLLLAPVAHAEFKTQSAMFRDVSKEDGVATAFENARKQAAAKRLSRIKFRDDVQELVCTAALTDRAPMYSTGVPALGSDAKLHHPASALYRTTEPGNVTDEMKRLASVDPLHKLGYRRYSVAVWRSTLSGHEDGYWVGIQFYWSQGMEFFDYHFTDDIWYHNAWKNTVAPECRSR